MKITDLTPIFNQDEAPNCDVYHQFLYAVNAAARTCGLTRQGIVNRMNQALKVDDVVINETLLNKYLAPGTEKYLPAHQLPALLWAIKSIEPLNVLLEPLLFKAVDQRSQLLEKHAELQMEIEKFSEQQREIQKTLLPSSSNQ
ncbi:hypothetical protein [Pseudoalteromonas gelatinilytica]|uniref:hypothetical protein n=1 Tax=Pseudoalteromonas gelatinilytica TaxID=1703256 RepID=UPI0007C4BCC6|nr:hypothetical protein [Pseudoalteromonas gelatinilytica]